MVTATSIRVGAGLKQKQLNWQQAAIDSTYSGSDSFDQDLHNLLIGSLGFWTSFYIPCRHKNYSLTGV
jgi:hypothetical protein